MTHKIEVRGPIRYPGGRDGWYVFECSEGDYVSYGPRPDSKNARMASKAHAEAKNANETRYAAERATLSENAIDDPPNTAIEGN